MEASTFESMDVLYNVEDHTFWWVVDWLLQQDIKHVHDKLIYEFLHDVEEEDYPAPILARFFLRQIKKWSSDTTRKLKTTKKGAFMPSELDFHVPCDLLDHLNKLSSSSRVDEHYSRGKLSRKGLKVNSKLVARIQALRGATDGEYDVKRLTRDALEDLSKYASQADEALGPCYLKQLESRLVGSQKRKNRFAPNSPPNAAEREGEREKGEELLEAWLDDDDQEELSHDEVSKEEEMILPTRKRAKVTKVTSSKPKAAARKQLPESESELSEEDSDFEEEEEAEEEREEVELKPSRVKQTKGRDELKSSSSRRRAMYVDENGNPIHLTKNISIGDQETREAIEELQKSSKNLRAIGTDPLEDALAQAKQAKRQSRGGGGVFGVEAEAGENESKRQSSSKKKGFRFTQKQAGGQVLDFDDDSEDEIEGEKGSEEASLGIGGRVQRAALEETTQNVNNGAAKRKHKASTRRKVDMESGRRANTYWTEEEASRLVDGVMKFGKGKWKLILEWGKREDFFLARNAVDLKDKFRNLEKYALADAE